MIIEDRTTAKFHYVTEMIQTPEAQYFIESPVGHVCTAYKSEQEARAHIPYMAQLFGFDPALAKISVDNIVRTTIRHHRYKV